jgi:predicted RNA-binding protein with PIN domain
VIIIIDGYNVIKQVIGTPHVSNIERDACVDQLAAYIRKQKFEGIIVFDGGTTSTPYRMNYQGITIIFSGYKEKADHVIMRLIDDHANHELLIVSSDREIRNYAQAKNKTSIAANDFYYHVIKKKPEKPDLPKTALHKTAHDTTPSLDALMEEASRTIPSKDEDKKELQKHQPQRASKKERRSHRLLRKL